MNAADQVYSFVFAGALASAINLVSKRFPASSPSLTPWRDDPETRRWREADTVDLAFHFPGWSPRLECRSLLIQLRFSDELIEASPHLLGVIIRGMTFEGERWRFATIGNWEATGTHLPQAEQIVHLHQLCSDLFSLFPSEGSLRQPSNPSPLN